jgi:hypothetical protein
LTCAAYRTAVGMGAGGDGVAGGRVIEPVLVAVSLACRALSAAVANSACMGCRTAAGMGAGRSGASGGGAKGPIVTTVSVV